jgi:hypothetical protein
MRYQTARSVINHGDVLAIRGHGVLPFITRAVQRLGGLGDVSAVTHMGVAWWYAGRLFCVEMDGRHNVLRPLSQHVALGCQVDVYRCPAPHVLEDSFDQMTEAPIAYSVMDLVRIGLRLLFGIRPPADRGGLVCSTFTVRWLQAVGWAPPNTLPPMPAPAEVCLALGQPAFSIKGA